MNVTIEANGTVLLTATGEDGKEETVRFTQGLGQALEHLREWVKQSRHAVGLLEDRVREERTYLADLEGALSQAETLEEAAKS